MARTVVNELLQIDRKKERLKDLRATVSTLANKQVETAKNIDSLQREIDHIEKFLISKGSNPNAD